LYKPPCTVIGAGVVKDGGSEKRKRAVAEDYFDEDRKRARLGNEPEARYNGSLERPEEREV
jgi:hypothetical protein